MIGVIYVDSPLHVGSFSAADLDLLTALANYAAVGIERARLNERIRSERAARDRLERYHSPAVIEAVLGGTEHEEPSVTLRETSILFADIVGFTPMSSRLAPENVVELLDAVFTEFDKIAAYYELEKIKTIGDCYMVASGVPQQRDDHALVLTQLALEMQEVVAKRLYDGRRLAFRIGINSGPVVAGVHGSRKEGFYFGFICLWRGAFPGFADA